MFICRGPRFDLVAHGTMRLQDVNDSVGTYDLVVEAATGKILVKHMQRAIVTYTFYYTLLHITVPPLSFKATTYDVKKWPYKWGDLS